MAEAEQTTQRSKSTPVGQRLFALAIAGVAFALMVWLGRNDVPAIQGVWARATGQLTVSNDVGGNPALAACLQQRVGDVERMKSEKVINETQYQSFKARAISLCEAQNPPQN